MLRANELQRVVNLTENVSVSGVVYPAGGGGGGTDIYGLYRYVPL